MRRSLQWRVAGRCADNAWNAAGTRKDTHDKKVLITHPGEQLETALRVLREVEAANKLFAHVHTKVQGSGRTRLDTNAHDEEPKVSKAFHQGSAECGALFAYLCFL